jgi:hypothetical protein
LDRPRRRPGLLIAAPAALAAAGLIAASAPSGPPALRALRWLAPSAIPAQALTRRPAECLAEPGNPADAYGIELGRAAFRSPLVLGGQAARAGVACETCHRGGRTNPDFDFPGVSGAPGTADVTTAVLSSHRGDGIDNPKPIPDLSGAKSALKVDQTPGGGKLEAFIEGVITQEFDGAEPPASVLKGLAAYVRALSPGACPPSAFESINAATATADARRAVRAAIAALGHDDPASALVMTEAARAQLGDIYERFAAPELAGDRAALGLASQDLAAAEDAIRRDPRGGSVALTLWLARSNGWAPQVEADNSRSLYDPERLAAAVSP